MPWDEIGVLFRTNAQSARFEAAFTRRNVPFRVAQEQRFAARASVRLVLEVLRKSEREAPARAFSEHLSDLAFLPDKDEYQTEDVLEHRDALLELGRAYRAAEDGPGSVASFTSWLDATTRGDAARDAGVELSTFHRAKGLEWPVVFVTGLERGLVPINSATEPDAVEEERRLLHVACSRAGDELYCSWARAREQWARASFPGNRHRGSARSNTQRRRCPDPRSISPDIWANCAPRSRTRRRHRRSRGRVRRDRELVDRGRRAAIMRA